MRSLVALMAASLLVLTGVSNSLANDPENEVISKYLKRSTQQQAHKLSWMSFNCSWDRINRDNSYNSFADYTSDHLSGAKLDWLGNGWSLGLDLGIMLKDRLSWSVGGEYWMKMGETISGSYTYDTPLITATTVENPSSEMSVWGFSTGLWYYPFQRPSASEGLTGLTFRFGGTVGYYGVSWDLWDEYASMNLATGQVAGNNITFKGSTIGFSAGVGADYPLNIWGMSLGMNVGYQQLNFQNVAWYNWSDQEVVATYDGTTNGRVDLDLSGIRGKIELKKFFSW